MSPGDLLQLVLQSNTPLSMIIGFWIAGRWLPDVRTWIKSIGARSFVASRTGQLLVWVVLGVLFAGPVSDGVGVVGSGVQLLSGGPAMGSMSTIWGSLPFAVFAVVAILTTIVVYALVVRIGYRQWPDAEEEAETAGSSLAWEEWFVLLAVASLVTRLILSAVRSLVWLPPTALPNGYFILVSQLAVLVAMIVGLWIGRRWLPDLIDALGPIGAQSFASSGTSRLIIWLALGALFGAPLLDLSGMIVTAVQLLFGPLANVGAMSTVWGTEPVMGYNKVWILTTLVIYLLVGWIVHRLWPESEAAESKGKSTLTVEQVFLLLAAASLMNQFAQVSVLGVIWLPIPNAVDMGRLSAVGFFGGWLVGLAIVAVILLALYASLRKNPISG